MKIYFASDHAGFETKNALIEYVKDLGYETEDCGAFEYDEHDDYPEYIKAAVRSVANDIENSKAIILGKSGEGEAMVANKFPHIRAALFHGGALEVVRLSRQHNDANVLSLGAGFMSAEEAKEAVKLWLLTPFSGEERHKRRIHQIEI